MILLSIGTVHTYNLDRAFFIAGDLGFDGVELIIDDRRSTYDPVGLKSLIDRYRLPILSIHSPFGFIEIPEWGSDPVERMRRTLKLAEDIGSEIVVIHLPFFTERRYARWLMNELPLWQSKTKVKLAVENMPHSYKLLGWLGVPLNTGAFYEVDRHKGINSLLRLISKRCYPHNNWKTILSFDHLVLDTTHLATGGIDPIVAYEKMKSKLTLIHVSNFDGKEHQPLGMGTIDMEGFLRHVKADDYRGIVTLELIPEHFPDGTEATAKKILADDLALIRSSLRG